MNKLNFWLQWTYPSQTTIYHLRKRFRDLCRYYFRPEYTIFHHTFCYKLWWICCRKKSSSEKVLEICADAFRSQYIIFLHKLWRIYYRSKKSITIALLFCSDIFSYFYNHPSCWACFCLYVCYVHRMGVQILQLNRYIERKHWSPQLIFTKSKL